MTTINDYLTGKYGKGWHVTHRDVYGRTVIRGPMGSPSGAMQIGVVQKDGMTARFWAETEIKRYRDTWGTDESFFPIGLAPGAMAWGHFHKA